MSVVAHFLDMVCIHRHTQRGESYVGHVAGGIPWSQRLLGPSDDEVTETSCLASTSTDV